MISYIEIEVSIKTCDEKLASILYKSTEPENKFAPESIRLESSLEEKFICFKCKADFVKHPDLKMSTIKRTVDDYIWSINTAYKTAKVLSGSE